MGYDDLKIQIYTNFLYPGMVLKGDGFDEQGTKISDMDVPFTKEQIDRLILRGVKVLTYTRQRLKMRKQVSNPMLSDENLQRAMNVMQDIEGSLRNNKNSVSAKEVDEVIDGFIGDIRDNSDACLNLLDLASYDDYTYTHSINVSSLAMILGFSLNYEEDKIKMIGVAGLLHDIGKTMIPIDLINKPGKLTPEEWEVMRKHPVYAYNIMKSSETFNPTILNGVLFHHEKYTGKGYPFGIGHEKSNDIAEIISVVDVFDAITSERAYKPGKPFYEAFTAIMENSGTKFNPKFAQVFLRDMVKKLNDGPLYEIGDYILLNTGEIAFVLDYRQSQFTLRPIINIFFNPNKEIKFLKFTQQVDLENDYNRYVVKKIIDANYVQKFNKILNIDPKTN